MTETNVPSNMSAYLSSLLTWTVDNDIELNTSETTEMILGQIDSSSISPLPTAAGPIQWVTNFKLLGINLDASLSWTTHINIIVSKASKRLYFLKQLRRAGVRPHQLLLFYTSVIRSVLEYAFPVWHYSITHAQSEQLESIQKRAIHIIFAFSRGMSYPNLLFVSDINSLKDRHDKLSRSFFQNTWNPASCLHYLLPPLVTLM